MIRRGVSLWTRLPPEPPIRQPLLRFWASSGMVLPGSPLVLVRRPLERAAFPSLMRPCMP